MFEPAFGAHFDDIAKALGGDQRRFGAAPLNQRIGRQSGAMDDLGDIGGRDARLFTDLMQALHDGVFRRRVGRQNFG